MKGRSVPKCRFCPFALPRFYRLADGRVKYYQAGMESHLYQCHERELRRTQKWAEAASTVPPRGE